MKVFLTALAARAMVALWGHRLFPPSADGFYYDTIARRIAGGHGYTWLWPDGAVTYAAHYPIGYPAILGGFYALFGAKTIVAMLVNALIGSAGAAAAYALLRRYDRRAALVAGLVVALHPALVPYTAAVMTEGVTASLLMIAAALAEEARHAPRAWMWRLLCALCMGIATLVRPQCLVLAPVLGLLSASGWKPRLLAAAAATGIAVLVCVPWTIRNCKRMDRCALVSVNGGWNLLIGVQTRSGAWAPVDPPPECEKVWSEAEKDACFERVARARIARSPGAWLAQAPRKLGATFDYFGAAPWYLHAANGAAFSEKAKVMLGTVETIASRVLLMLALVYAARTSGPRRVARMVIAGAGIVCAITPSGWLAYASLTVALALLGRALADKPLVVPATAALVFATALTHAAFFGAGRYGLVVVPFIAACALVPAGAHCAASTPYKRSPAPETEREESPSSTEREAG